MRVTKKWLREAKFKMRADIQRLSKMDIKSLQSECIKRLGVNAVDAPYHELLEQCLLWALEDAIPYDMVN
jgi:hypothetical protein